jgi:hypothetical protein
MAAPNFVKIIGDQLKPLVVLHLQQQVKEKNTQSNQNSQDFV